jgi:hypothetical protein
MNLNDELSACGREDREKLRERERTPQDVG